MHRNGSTPTTSWSTTDGRTPSPQAWRGVVGQARQDLRRGAAEEAAVRRDQRRRDGQRAGQDRRSVEELAGPIRRLGLGRAHRADAGQRLKRVEAADVMQVKSFDTGKFIERQGRLSAAEMDDITAALAIVVEYE